MEPSGELLVYLQYSILLSFHLVIPKTQLKDFKLTKKKYRAGCCLNYVLQIEV